MPARQFGASRAIAMTRVSLLATTSGVTFASITDTWASETLRFSNTGGTPPVVIVPPVPTGAVFGSNNTIWGESSTPIFGATS